MSEQPNLSLDYYDDKDLMLHVLHVSEGVSMLAKKLGIIGKKYRDLMQAALFHDIWKVHTPPSIVNKPAPLNYEEFRIMKEHPLKGANLVRKRFKASDDIYFGIRDHHEQWNGTGYPSCLKGEQIHVNGRIITVADSWSTMILGRPYREPVPHDEAVAEIKRCSGGQFDPRIAEVFAEIAPDLQKILIEKPS